MPSKAARCSKSRLHLIPRHLRKEFEKMLGVHIEGDLCPVCRYKLQQEYAGKYEEFPGLHHGIFQARPRRHRRGAAGRSQQPGHLGADRQRRYFQARSLFRRRSAGFGIERRAQRRQPRPGRVHRSLQKRDRIPPLHDHRDPGKSRAGARAARLGLRRHGHRRPFQRSRMAEVQGRPYQRSDSRPHRRGARAVQPTPVRRSENLSKDHPQL